MNDLRKELAPISEHAWEEIEQEAKRTLVTFLAARKLVDFEGPRGWEHAAVTTGRTTALDKPLREGVQARLRRVQPLVELRTSFSLGRAELEDIGRGAADANLEPLVDAAKTLALAEDHAVFHGASAASIQGIMEVAAPSGVTLSDEFDAYPKRVVEATHRLRTAGVSGPYALALGPRCYNGLHTTFTPGGYPVIKLVEDLVDGPIVWAPAIDGAVVMSTRGGDFELTIGQDISIGYLGHDDAKVDLYLQESMTFRCLGPEAAVPLRYGA